MPKVSEEYFENKKNFIIDSTYNVCLRKPVGMVTMMDVSDMDKQDSEIRIDVEQNSVFTRINIRDQGIGMSEETMTHIFERFYRASNEVNPNSVGIGLSLSKSIIEGMGGRITVESKLGEGSCFKISFDTLTGDKK